MVHHCEGHVIFQDTEYELQEILYFITIFIISFYEIFIKLGSIFDPLKKNFLQLL